ncbi:ABC transporter permease subunit [Natronobeatus ordinarius]|uniref:ABC transporter permease subunit n=1 Tax=Natronobeatus ordinarius TaxID=2963433 RepID=UPI0020CEA7B3|nr:ABC transporter permease subunit [Natronobeatus ordinarius]
MTAEGRTDEADRSCGSDADTAGNSGTAGSQLHGVLERTGRIARWEVTRSAGTVDRTTVFVVITLVLVVGVVGPSVADAGLNLEDDLYVVGVDEESPYHDVVLESDAFRAVALPDVDNASVDLVIRDDEVEPVGDNGAPAAEAFREAVAAYNERLMRQEPNETAAQPVVVVIEYEGRSLADALEAAEDEGTAGADDEDEDAADDDATEADDGASGDGGGEVDGDGRDDAADGDRAPNASAEVAADGDAPGTISPPFPFQSLVLAFLFVVPMNFVAQAYGSTIMDERIKRRGELLLVAPVSRYEIVAGKTLPYLLALVAIVVGIAVTIGGGIVSVAAALPIALLFLAATFTGAMFARSFKELTFVTVAISVFLTTYTFVPAIFTDVTPIALISPLTLVVMDLQGDSVGLGTYLFSTGPSYLTAVVLFLFGVGSYREEDMFAQKPIPTKVIDTIASRLSSTRTVPLFTMLTIPFVFVAQLLAVALLFAAPPVLAFALIFVFAAAVEELAKSLHVYAGFARARFESTVTVAVGLGVLSGSAFFVAEKATQVVQFVGLEEFEVAVAAFGPETFAHLVTTDPLVFAGLFLAPLGLHVVTAVITAVGATRGRTVYALALAAATIVHAGYNIGVILLVT